MLKDDTKVLALALPNFCVGHSAAVLTGLEHNHKRWLPVARAFVLPTSCNDRFRSCALAWSTTFDGGCGSMFALKLDVRACTRLLSVAVAARRSPLLLAGTSEDSTGAKDQQTILHSPETIQKDQRSSRGCARWRWSCRMNKE